MINKNSPPGRKMQAQEQVGGPWWFLLPSDWMRLMLRSTEPARDLMEQWFGMSGQAFPLWMEYHRLWDRWARGAMAWPGGAPFDWGQALAGPWSMWLRTAGGAQAPARLAEGLEDLRQEVASLRRDLDRHESGHGE